MLIEANARPSLVHRSAWVISISLGVFAVWIARHTMGPDGLAYIELAELYREGRWWDAVNGYWSPLYAVMLAAIFGLFDPPPSSEFAVAHLATLGSYLMSLAAFTWMASELDRTRCMAIQGLPSPFSSGEFLLLGYSLFLWSSLTMISLEITNPDLLVSAAAYSVVAILARAARSGGSITNAALLGVICGAGFLAKTVMFILAFVFIGVLATTFPTLRRAVRSTVVSLVVFLLLAALLVVPLSQKKGRFTFGDVGRLAYAMYVSGFGYYNYWQGSPESGVPKHPTRILSHDPPVFEFATPFDVTYPPWFDPSYWNEGMTPRFDLPGHGRSLFEAGKTYWVLFGKTQWAFVAVLILLFGLQPFKRGMLSLLTFWRLLLVPLFPLALYALVHVERRYVGPFMVMLFSIMLCAVRGREGTRVARTTAVIVSGSLLVYVMAGMVKDYGRLSGMTAPEGAEVAVELTGLGFRTGEPLAFLGTGYQEMWPRLIRARIVAEIPDWGVEEYWEQPVEVIEELDAKLRKLGVYLILSRNVPICCRARGWQRAGQTEYFFRYLGKSHPSE